MGDWPKLLAQAESLIRAILPELDGTPIYLVQQSETVFRDSLAAGFTGRGVDLMIRDFLGSRWRGRGVAIVLNTGLIEQHHGDVETVVYALALHEIAHSVCDGWALSRQTEPTVSASDVAEAVSIVIRRESTESWLDENGLTLAEFRGHDAIWLRICAHLAFRSGSAPLDIIGDRAELAVWRYVAVTANEVERLADVPITTIATMPLPEQLASQWQHDLARFETARSVSGPDVLFSQKEVDPMKVLERIISKVSGSLAKKQKSAAERFAALVKTVADEKDVDDGEVLAILDESGKTTADLESGVKAIFRRRQLQVIVKRGKDAAVERSRLDQAAAAAAEAFEKAKRLFAESIGPLNGRLVELDELQRQASKARAELESDCDDTSIQAELQDLEDARRELRNRQAKLQQQKKAAGDEILANVKSELVRPAIIPGTWQREYAAPPNPREIEKKLAPALASGLSGIEADIANVAKNLDAIAEKEKEVRAKMVTV